MVVGWPPLVQNRTKRWHGRGGKPRWWWWKFLEAPGGVRVGLGAEDQSFLFLKCNKSIRELGRQQHGFWGPAAQAT